MTRAFAAFELRRQLTGHVFWVVFAISTLMVTGSIGIDALRVGAHPTGLRNGAEAIVATHGTWSLFFMFATAAFVADAVLRDEQAGFAPVFAALPVPRAAYLYGRFAGAFAAVLLCFLSVPLGIVLGAAMPWVDPATVGPLRPAALAQAYAVIAVPNLLLSAAAGFALATWSRSLGVALVGAIALLTAYGLGAKAGAVLPPVWEPFGFAAYADAVAGWTGAMRDTSTPPLAGVLLANRLFVLALSAALLALASLRTASITPKRRRADGVGTAAAQHLPRIAPTFDRWTTLRQGVARTRLELWETVQTPVFAALILLGLANALASLWPLRHAGDALAAARTLGDAFQLTPVVMALFFAGDLRWREREAGLGPLIGATPIAAAAFLLPKFLALALVLVATLATGAAAAALLLPGPATTLLPAWLLWANYDALTFAALTLFLQAGAPNKLAGWGFTVLYLIGTMTLDRLGWVDPAYRYARYPAQGAAPYLFGWAAVAVLLIATATKLARPSRHAAA